MIDVHPDASWLWLGVIGVAGLASALAARLSEGSAAQTACQRLFFSCLALVAFSTVLSWWLGRGCCLVTGATLSLMALAATFDGGTTRRAVC